MGNGGGGGEPSVIKGGGGGGGEVVGRGRGPRPRGEMTGWGGQHHRPPLRPRGRAGRGAGRSGAVVVLRGLSRTLAARGGRVRPPGRKVGRDGTGAASCGAPVPGWARAPPPPQPRGVALCRVGTGWVGGWRVAAAPRGSFPSAPPVLVLILFPPSLSLSQIAAVRSA
jgi:hypothetical protein